jgi:hypothetical protein
MSIDTFFQESYFLNVTLNNSGMHPLGKRYSTRTDLSLVQRLAVFIVILDLCKQMGKCLKATCTWVKEIVKISCA